MVERSGGTVEELIGDAVMAVRKTPIATEDDAGRAALELVADIRRLEPSLVARVGVPSGEAAVTLGAESKGMVAGDLVKTAARIQAATALGSVPVGKGTKGPSEAAIAFEDPGEHALTGKAKPVRLFPGLRVRQPRRRGPLGWARRSMSAICCSSSVASAS